MRLIEWITVIGVICACLFCLYVSVWGIILLYREWKVRQVD